MEVRKIGKRNIVFSFYDLGIPTNISVIIGREEYFIIDSYLGSKPMEKVDRYLLDNYGRKKYILINTHSDWDHIWGNGYFKDSQIICHRLCYEHIEKEADYYLKKNKSYIRGKADIVNGNLTFDRTISYPKEAIEIFYSPGHSDDSISILDKRDRLLYVGDNLESPLPYVQSKDLKAYIKTLTAYLDLDIDRIVAGHTGIAGRGLILRNLSYVEELYKGRIPKLESEEEKSIHKTNIDFLNKN